MSLTGNMEPAQRSRAVSAAAALLAERHRMPADFDPDRSLLHVAEAPRAGDWSLRSALVRLAQPEPVRAGAVLELIRRNEGALAPLSRTLERHVVSSSPGLTPSALVAADTGWPSATDDDLRPDVRLADLARLAGADPDLLAELVAAYGALVELEPEERTAAPLLLVAAQLDQLADIVCRWALIGSGSPPVDEIDRICHHLAPLLDQFGVPRETRPESRAAGERRSGGRRGGASSG